MIGVFDSGIGGLTIFNELIKQLPNYDFIYYGDSKNNPYGEKSSSELLEITSSIVMHFKELGCKVIVIACNTATTKCMKALREKFPDIIFVGTVPAVKVACDNDFKNILVMATPATIESDRMDELVRFNKREDQNIYLLPCFGLANAIERNDKNEIKSILANIFYDYKDKNIDSIVLGCTHYPHIKKEILEEMPNISLIDGTLGVCREVKRQLLEHNISSGSGNIKILDSLE